MSDYFFQLPPDSSGKKSTALAIVELYYTGHTDSMSVGDTILGNTSGAFGEIVRIVPDDFDSSIGFINITMDVDSPTIIFQDGENLLTEGLTVAQADGGGDAFYTQKTSIAGANSPFNGVFVDRKGALYTRNAEGSQQYDAFGLVRGSSPTPIADYTFEYGVDNSLWQKVETGGASVNSLPDSASVALDVGIASGDVAQITTHNYHRYQPGMGQMLEMTITHGDTSKAGLLKQWGYFDDNDGIFFEIDDNGDFNVVQRSSTSGSVQETRVSRNDWNGDRINGSGGLRNLSDLDLDIKNMNIFWIDFGWLGAGATRLGVYDPHGGRIVCHVFENGNSIPRPFIRTGSLPIRARIENTGVTGAPSRMSMTCATVHTDGVLTPDRKRKTTKRGILGQKISNITTKVPLLSIRPALTFNGIVNRKIIIPEIFSFYIEDQPIRLSIVKNATLTGDSWTSIPNDSSVEYDDSATAISGGVELLGWILAPGAHNVNSPPNFGVQGENIKLLADGSVAETYTICAESLTAVAQAQTSLTWIEVE